MKTEHAQSDTKCVHSEHDTTRMGIPVDILVGILDRSMGSQHFGKTQVL